MDGSDVGFRMDFSCHRAVDLSFLRRLYRAHDRRSFHGAWGWIHHDSEETSRLRRDSKNYVNK